MNILLSYALKLGVVVPEEHGICIVHIAEVINIVQNIVLKHGEGKAIERKIQMDYIWIKINQNIKIHKIIQKSTTTYSGQKQNIPLYIDKYLNEILVS